MGVNGCRPVACQWAARLPVHWFWFVSLLEWTGWAVQPRSTPPPPKRQRQSQLQRLTVPTAKPFPKTRDHSTDDIFKALESPDVGDVNEALEKEVKSGTDIHSREGRGISLSFLPHSPTSGPRSPSPLGPYSLSHLLRLRLSLFLPFFGEGHQVNPGRYESGSTSMRKQSVSSAGNSASTAGRGGGSQGDWAGWAPEPREDDGKDSERGSSECRWVSGALPEALPGARSTHHIRTPSPSPPTPTSCPAPIYPVAFHSSAVPDGSSTFLSPSSSSAFPRPPSSSAPTSSSTFLPLQPNSFPPSTSVSGSGSVEGSRGGSASAVGTPTELKVTLNMGPAGGKSASVSGSGSPSVGGEEGDEEE
ncbi:hypothetical protein NMY22_g14187 [Coprinellus aureogranulatus]|nr:hypothetical protein NMY22_g14187 [Coprinellus aureogranulatus]